MKKITLRLIALRISVALWNLREYARVVLRYYRYPKFRQNDIKLLTNYWGRSPFKISKEFCAKRGDADIYVYGETPLTTWELISDKARILKDDVVFDLGAGRGRGCLWLNGVLGCTAIGIEEIPEFVEKACLIAKGQSGLEFRQGDLGETDLSRGTVFYLYGNFLSDEKIKQLAQKVPRGTKMISVSFPMSDYNARFKTLSSFKAPFPWGLADVYLSISN